MNEKDLIKIATFIRDTFRKLSAALAEAIKPLARAIGLHIYKHRRRLGMTQRAYAAEIGWGVMRLRRVERLRLLA